MALALIEQFFAKILSDFLPFCVNITASTSVVLSKVKPVSTFQVYLSEAKDVKSFCAVSRCNPSAITFLPKET